MASVNTPCKSSPREAQIMAAILKDMGVNEYEPRVLNQMMEFSYRKLYVVNSMCLFVSLSEGLEFTFKAPIGCQSINNRLIQKMT